MTRDKRREETIDMKEPFKNYSTLVTTVALYGQEEPVLFKGRLILREYYTENTKKEIDQKKSNAYALDTIYYETNKVIRANMNEPFDEARELVVRKLAMLEDPYRIVYNANAEPGQTVDNHLTLLNDQDANAHGVALILKEAEDGSLQTLIEAEARAIIRELSAMM